MPIMVYKQTTLEILVTIALMKKKEKKKRHRPFLPRKNENHRLKVVLKKHKSCCTYVLIKNGNPF